LLRSRDPAGVDPSEFGVGHAVGAEHPIPRASRQHPLSRYPRLLKVLGDAAVESDMRLRMMICAIERVRGPQTRSKRYPEIVVGKASRLKRERRAMGP